MSDDRFSRLTIRVQRLLSKHVAQARYLSRSSLISSIGLSLLLTPGYVLAVLPAADTGNLYVSMWNSDQIAVFHPDGSSLERFTAEGLDGPRGIAFQPNNGEIWVAAEFSDAVYIFDRGHRLLRTLTHPDFNEPVGITFITSSTDDSGDLEAVISNSNSNELMVFNLEGQLQRRFTDDTLNDPNCSAEMPDGSLLVTNRLGGSMGSAGSVASFSGDEQFQFDFTTAGIASLMAVARNPGQAGVDEDDTLWVSSGAGSLGIYEFDQSGNLLQSVLPADINGGSRIVPQGLSVDDSGDLFVVSFTGEVFRFDAEGQFLQRFDTGPGTPRSSAFAICPMNCSTQGQNGTDSASFASSSNGGFSGVLLLALLAGFGLHRRSTASS